MKTIRIKKQLPEETITILATALGYKEKIIVEKDLGEKPINRFEKLKQEGVDVRIKEVLSVDEEKNIKTVHLVKNVEQNNPENEKHFVMRKILETVDVFISGILTEVEKQKIQDEMYKKITERTSAIEEEVKNFPSELELEEDVEENVELPTK